MARLGTREAVRIRWLLPCDDKEFNPVRAVTELAYCNREYITQDRGPMAVPRNPRSGRTHNLGRMYCDVPEELRLRPGTLRPRAGSSQHRVCSYLKSHLFWWNLYDDRAHKPYWNRRPRL